MCEGGWALKCNSYTDPQWSHKSVVCERDYIPHSHFETVEAENQHTDNMYLTRWKYPGAPEEPETPADMTDEIKIEWHKQDVPQEIFTNADLSSRDSTGLALEGRASGDEASKNGKIYYDLNKLGAVPISGQEQMKKMIVHENMHVLGWLKNKGELNMIQQETRDENGWVVVNTALKDSDNQIKNNPQMSFITFIKENFRCPKIPDTRLKNHAELILQAEPEEKWGIDEVLNAYGNNQEWQLIEKLESCPQNRRRILLGQKDRKLSGSSCSDWTPSAERVADLKIKKDGSLSGYGYTLDKTHYATVDSQGITPELKEPYVTKRYEIDETASKLEWNTVDQNWDVTIKRNFNEDGTDSSSIKGKLNLERNALKRPTMDKLHETSMYDSKYGWTELQRKTVPWETISKGKDTEIENLDITDWQIESIWSHEIKIPLKEEFAKYNSEYECTQIDESGATGTSLGKCLPKNNSVWRIVGEGSDSWGYFTFDSKSIIDDKIYEVQPDIKVEEFNDESMDPFLPPLSEDFTKFDNSQEDYDFMNWSYKSTEKIAWSKVNPTDLFSQDHFILSTEFEISGAGRFGNDCWFSIHNGPMKPNRGKFYSVFAAWLNFAASEDDLSEDDSKCEFDVTVDGSTVTYKIIDQYSLLELTVVEDKLRLALKVQLTTDDGSTMTEEIWNAELPDQIMVKDKVSNKRTQSCRDNYPITTELGFRCGTNTGHGRIVKCGDQDFPYCVNNDCIDTDQISGKINGANYNDISDSCKSGYTLDEYSIEGTGGKWGGTCVCPSGHVYYVGVKREGDCAELACENGFTLSCSKFERSDKSQGEPWSGRSVKCWKNQTKMWLTGSSEKGVYGFGTDAIVSKEFRDFYVMTGIYDQQTIKIQKSHIAVTTEDVLTNSFSGMSNFLPDQRRIQTIWNPYMVSGRPFIIENLQFEIDEENEIRINGYGEDESGRFVMVSSRLNETLPRFAFLKKHISSNSIHKDDENFSLEYCRGELKKNFHRKDHPVLVIVAVCTNGDSFQIEMLGQIYQTGKHNSPLGNERDYHLWYMLSRGIIFGFGSDSQDNVKNPANFQSVFMVYGTYDGSIVKCNFVYPQFITDHHSTPSEKTSDTNRLLFGNIPSSVPDLAGAANNVSDVVGVTDLASAAGDLASAAAAEAFFSVINNFLLF